MVKPCRKEALPHTKVLTLEKKIVSDLSELEHNLPHLPPTSSNTYAAPEKVIHKDRGISPLIFNEKAASMTLLQNPVSDVQNSKGSPRLFNYESRPEQETLLPQKNTTSGPYIPKGENYVDSPSESVYHHNLLKDISNELAEDSPFFLELKFKELFNSFLDELSQKFEDLPGSLLENCVLSFSIRMTESMYNLINTEVIPILFNKIMAHSKNSEKGVAPHHLRENDHIQLLSQLLEKIDSLQYALQDALHVNDSQHQANDESLAIDIGRLDKLCGNNFSRISEHINDLNVNERNRFEQVKRR
ncbi:hypothetical protein VP01_4657g1 [Puccinia sorghi]|uniref:Uncharacterized protein n=1 Tax=Puccinia sorghi TaxID=27349 RepID=A0A0L6UN77_9BASI|nr:hypothetical protein VP01_4657g1 [Puccinia sorghi]